MTFDERAAEIRREADQEAIAKLLDLYPWGQDVEPRPAGTVSESIACLDRLSRNPTKRRKKIEQRIQSYRQSLARSIQKHDSLKRNGLAEVGDFDLMVCYSENPLSACKWTMELHQAHISYGLSIIAIMDAELGKLDTSVPAGFVQVDAILTAHQAYQVRKWAEQAKARLNQARAKARMDTKREQRESK